jgi:hypothetical protein
MTIKEDPFQKAITIEGLTLSDEHIERYIEVVTHTAKQRAKALGEVFHDVDFAMGAAVILFATGNNGRVPPAWIFNAMRDVPIFDHRTKEGSE